MATVQSPNVALPLIPPQKRWTRQEVTSIDGHGMLERRLYELVEGDLISRMGKKWPHSSTLSRLLLGGSSIGARCCCSGAID